MKIIDFPKSNAVYAKNQPEYLPLPSYKTSDGYVTSCWEPTFWETVKLMFGSKIWVTIMTCNNPLQPQRLEIGAEMPEMEK
jgi:hypothetical protein